MGLPTTLIPRLKRVTLVSAHESSDDTSDSEVHELVLNYRAEDDPLCPGKLDSVGSPTTKVRGVKYEYQQAQDANNNNTCLLHTVNYQTGGDLITEEGVPPNAEFENQWQFSYGIASFNDAHSPFMRGAGYRVIPSSYFYLPLKSVRTSTGAQVEYDYDVLFICEYQLLSRLGSKCIPIRGTGGDVGTRGDPRRPAVVKRSVSDAIAASNVQVTNFNYDTPVDSPIANAQDYFTARVISDEVNKHTFVFGQVERNTSPIYETYADIGRNTYEWNRLMRSGRLANYSLEDLEGNELYSIVIDYKEGQDSAFLSIDGLGNWYKNSREEDNSYYQNSLLYLYDARRINIFSTKIFKDGYSYEVRNVTFDDVYNNLLTKREISVDLSTGINSSERNITYTYDNNVANKQIWFVGGIASEAIEGRQGHQ